MSKTNSSSAQTEHSVPKTKSKTIRLVAIVVVAAVLAASVPLAWIGVRNARMQEHALYVFNGVLQEESIFNITLDEKDQTYRAAETHRHGQTGKFSYFCDSTLVLASRNAYGPIVFGNPSANDCILVLTILDKDGEMLYRSGGVLPGKYISQIRLLSAPDESGTYACRAYVSAYDRQTKERIGVQYSKLSVQIGG